MLRVAAAFALPFVVVGHDLPDSTDPILDDNLIKYINNQNGLGWKAGRNARFEGVSITEAKQLLGVKIPDSAVSCPKAVEVSVAALPTGFDARTQWPNYTHAVRDQQQCGSCWAFAASEALSDRLAIFSKGKYNLVLSPQDLVSCDTTDEGCGGGWPTNAANYLQNTGIPADTCDPYVSGGGQVPACPSQCQDGSPKTLYKYQSWDYCIGESALMTQLVNGPLPVAFAVYQDFFAYTSGIYKATTTALAGYHAVKMLGYGVDNGTKYWIVQNSWAATWGEKGYFRIVKGVDECNIEQGPLDKGCPLYGIPLLPSEVVV